MDTAFKLLVVIVSSVLALFLLLAIVALIKVIMLIHRIKRLADKAEHLADSAEAVGDFFKKNSSPLTILANIVESARKHRKQKEVD